MPGVLITIEGLDGTGKSTLAEALVEALDALTTEDVLLLREPGGVVLAEHLRTIVKNPSIACGARAEALIYAAARAQLVEEQVNPGLHRGATIVLDRYVDSSLAYQGAGRGLGVDEIAALNAFGTGGLVPDRTLLLQLDPAIRQERLRSRAAHPDRIEQAGDAFFATVADAYTHLAASDPDRVRVIDADSAPADVLADAMRAVSDLVPTPESTPRW